MDPTIIIALVVAVAVIAVIAIWVVARSKGGAVERTENVSNLVEEARKQAGIIRKEAELKVKEQLLASKAQFESEFEKRRTEIGNQEKRLQQKEESQNRKE